MIRFHDNKQIIVILSVYIVSIIGCYIYFNSVLVGTAYYWILLAAAGPTILIGGVYEMSKRNLAAFKTKNPQQYELQQEIKKTLRSDPKKAIALKLGQISLEKAMKKIKHSWIAGLVMVILTLFTELSLMFNQYGFSLLALFIIIFEILVLSAMVLGIYLKNKYCAISLFIYYLLSALFALLVMRKFIGILNILILSFLYQGILGIMRYQQLEGVPSAEKKNIELVYAIVIACLALGFWVYIVILRTGSLSF